MYSPESQRCYCCGLQCLPKDVHVLVPGTDDYVLLRG